MIADVGVGFQPQVAAVVGGPVVVLLHEDGADEAEDRGLVGEDADDVGAALDLGVERSSGLVEAIFGQCRAGKAL